MVKLACVDREIVVDNGSCELGVSFICEPLKVNSIQINGDQEIEIPVDGEVTRTYFATVKDKFGHTVIEKLNWEIDSGGTEGVLLDNENSILRVFSHARPAILKIKVTCRNNKELSDELEIILGKSINL